jgi:hypothetical protein
MAIGAIAIGASAISKITTGQQHRNETTRCMTGPLNFVCRRGRKTSVQPTTNETDADCLLFAIQLQLEEQFQAQLN